MPGLDKSVVASINPEISLARITRDVQSDLILAPHYNAIFLKAGSELWERTSELLRSGKFQPELALTISASGCPPEIIHLLALPKTSLRLRRQT
jgi:hypothetical protein